MPEHRVETPSSYRALESFLWNDFDTGLYGWGQWVSRKIPQASIAATESRAFRRAMQLHGALRSLQAENNDLATGEEDAAREVFNRLVIRHGIHPRLDEHGCLILESGESEVDAVSQLVLTALEAMQMGEWGRFKLCRDPTCRASYYDASKSAAKTWCSMETCGSRNKMRRYRAKS